MTSAAALVKEVRAGNNRELQIMAASGVLPVAPSELIPLQVALAGSTDREVAKIASTSLRSIESRLLASYLETEADPRTLSYFALEVSDYKVLEVIIQRRDVPRPLLVALAPNLGEELQEVLLLRQDAIVEDARILDALETNPQLSKYSRRRIREYREHLLPPEVPVEEPRARPEIEEASDRVEWFDGMAAADRPQTRVRLARKKPLSICEASAASRPDRRRTR